MSSAWKGKPDDGRPKLGRRGRLWQKRATLALLEKWSKQVKFKELLADADLTAVVEWLLEEPDRYVMWVDSTEYHGKRWSFGAWQLNHSELRKDLPLAVEVVYRERAREFDSEHIHSLDEWLKADIAGTLYYVGSFGGTQDLPPDLVEQVKLAATARRERLANRDRVSPSQPKRARRRVR